MSEAVDPADSGPPAFVPTLTEIVAEPHSPVGAMTPSGEAPGRGGDRSAAPLAGFTLRGLPPDAWREELQAQLCTALAQAVQACPELAQIERSRLLEAIEAMVPKALDEAVSPAASRRPNA